MSERRAIKKILTNRQHKNTGFYYKYKSPPKSWDQEEINLTVGLPIYNGHQVVEVALRSLARQINVDFSWELIIFEDFGGSKKIIDSYRDKLPGCKRVEYFVSRTKIPLLDKWSLMARGADPNSNVFVLQAADCYSAPERLKAHYELHKNNEDCIWSHQEKGVFYNLRDQSIFLYDGAKYKGEVLTHLSMALDTRLMRNVPTYKEMRKFDIRKNSRIDSHLLRSLIFQKPDGVVKNLEEVFPDIWKRSLDTDGKNTISTTRVNKFGTEHFIEIDEEVFKKYGYTDIADYIHPNDLILISKIKV